MIWSVGVLTPESVGNALIQLGLKRLDNFSGMVRDSGNSECGKTDLEIKVLDDPRNIVDWLKAFQSSFHLSKEAEDHYHKLIQPLLGRSQADVWLIGYVGDKPACSAGYSIENDVIMIYSVCTLPEFRKRGYGKQITEAAIKEGLKHKKLPVTLYSTAMALPLYKSMGFKPVYDMEMYLFEPRGK
jgi:GNAT superfamily N-acetyltransferase